MGSLEELIDDNHAIISTPNGPEYYVGILSIVDADLLEPNAAVLLHGAQPANHAMEAASAKLMAEIKQDWQNIAQLVRSHAPPCEALLRDAEYVPPR